MQKVKFIKTGKVVEVENNDAHALIEKGEAVLYKPEEKQLPSEENKMMAAEKPKGYKTK